MLYSEQTLIKDTEQPFVENTRAVANGYNCPSCISGCQKGGNDLIDISGAVRDYMLTQ